MKTAVDQHSNVPAPGALAAEGNAIRAPLAPLLAGARARGVADGLELVGAAAALLDEQGAVLHINARALRLMGDSLFLAGQRLHARDRKADEKLAAAIGSTLSQGVASCVAVGGDSEAGAVGVRIVPVATDGDQSFQLLRAVAIIEPPGEAFAPAGGASGLN
jgi:hypothetical protein